MYSYHFILTETTTVHSSLVCRTPLRKGSVSTSRGKQPCFWVRFWGGSGVIVLHEKWGQAASSEMGSGWSSGRARYCWFSKDSYSQRKTAWSPMHCNLADLFFFETHGGTSTRYASLTMSQLQVGLSYTSLYGSESRERCSALVGLPGVWKRANVATVTEMSTIAHRASTSPSQKQYSHPPNQQYVQYVHTFSSSVFFFFLC